MSINYMIYGSYKEISKKEYYDWLKDSSIISDERCVFSNCCGPHEFSTTIIKNGKIYELGWGWDNPELTWYGIRKLHIAQNQNGDGV